MSKGCQIRQTLKTQRPPSLPYQEMLEYVLGSDYDLSLVICGDRLARSVNKKYRAKSYAANVLSFPLSTLEGEIFLNARTAKRESLKYGVPLKNRMALLYIHGLHHLKGLSHGKNMERSVERTLRRFGY